MTIKYYYVNNVSNRYTSMTRSHFTNSAESQSVPYKYTIQMITRNVYYRSIP